MHIYMLCSHCMLEKSIVPIVNKFAVTGGAVRVVSKYMNVYMIHNWCGIVCNHVLVNYCPDLNHTACNFT